MLKTFFKNYFGLCALVLLVLALALTNYIPGTYLSGWDNLQSDLNPWLGVKRAFFSSWQEFQSFGLPAGMAHAADLLRAVSIWLMSYVLPASMLRYSYQFLMVLMGAIGAYKLVSEYTSGRYKQVLAFTGGVFYILNFMCIQLMFVPVEPFSVFLGMLPWELWIFLRVLGKKDVTAHEWGIFLLITALATPQAVAQQLFAVLLLLFGLLGLGRLIQEKFAFFIMRHGVIAAILIFSVNSFWIFPQVYFLKTNGAVVENAKINQLSTEDIYYRNKDKGNPAAFLSYTGFFYDSYDSQQKPLFQAWKKFRDNFPARILIYFLTGIVFLGMLRRSKYRLPFLLCYGAIAFSLLLNTMPFSPLNDFIRQNALINQIFRSPFTKFAIPYALISMYFFVCGVELIIFGVGKWIKNERKNRIAISIVLGGVIFLLLFQALPAFRGEYISAEMKVKIPQEYFDAFSYFKQIDKNKRIALLPEYTHWGWLYTNWGYDGSGFLWYGIEQPIISRNFDYWDNHSESYYWEVKRAIEREDLASVERVFEKYGVDYIIYDRSISPVVTSSKALQYDRLDTLLAESKKIRLVRKFGSLSLYQVSQAKTITAFLWGSNSKLPNIGPGVKVTDNDTAYKTYGTYETDMTKPYDAFYPFLDLTSQTQRKDQIWKLAEDGADFVFSRPTSFNLQHYFINSSQSDSNSDLYTQNTAAKFIIPYTTLLQAKEIQVRFPKIMVDKYDVKRAQLTPCTKERGRLFSQNVGNGFSLESKNGGYGCFNFDDPNLEQRNGYLLKIENKNSAGQRLFFYVLDKTKDQTYLEDRFTKDTQYYVIGSKYQQGIGYTFAFQINSYPTVPSKNELNSFSVYLIPYDALKQIYLFTPESRFAVMEPSFGIQAGKDSYYRYHAVVPESVKTLVLNQSFQAGWKMYVVGRGKQEAGIKRFLVSALPFFFGREVQDHVKINNWANGWNMPLSAGDKTVIIIYWPQYLEFAGMWLALGVTGVVIFVWRRALKK